MIELTKDERARYQRHLSLPEFGEQGQLKLKQSRVLVIGAGGLGSPAALYLAAAGVGTLGIADHDQVDISNLQRQILYSLQDIGRDKTEITKDRLHFLNPHVEINLHSTRIDASNALTILRDYDIIVDGTDNFSSRYLINDACVILKKPNIHGSIRSFEAQVSVFCVPQGPCYRCLFPTPPKPGQIPNCAEAGVLGVLPGIVGTLQAAEAIKWAAGIGNSLVGRLLLIDLLNQRFREMKLAPDISCALCGPSATITNLQPTVVEPDSMCGSNETNHMFNDDSLTPTELKTKLDKGESIVLLDVREPYEVIIATIGGIHIPMTEIMDRYKELDPSKPMVVYCHHGTRSLSVMKFLRGLGFNKARNLSGGIDRWALEIDPSLARY